MSVRVGLIGAGIMGADHARILRDGVPGAVLAAVHDLDPARARALAEECGAGRVVDDARALVDDPAVDAVIVASPDDTHGPLALACIARGKPVLCEKPLAAGLDGCRAVVAAEVAAGRRLVQVGYMRRFDPGYLAMKAALEGGDLGPALFMHCVHRNAVGPDYLTSELVIVNSAVHEIDVARFVLGEEVAAVTVISPRASGRAPARQPQLVVLEMVGGTVVDVEAFVDAQYGYDVRAELVCEGGTVALAPNPPIALRRDGREGFALSPDWRGRFAEAYRAQLRAWVDAIASGRPTGSSAWDGYAASAVAAACLEAYRSRTRVAVVLGDRPALYGDA